MSIPSPPLNEYPHKSSGVLHYSPTLLGEGSKWWLVVWADPELVRYYRHLHHLDAHRCDKLQRPAWESHITVIRDEEPPDARKWLWRKHQDHVVDFWYSTNVETDGRYWWLPVWSVQLLALRLELGLPRDPAYSLHLSIGHKSKDGRQ